MGDGEPDDLAVGLDVERPATWDGWTANVITSRLGGDDSSTVPTTSAMPEPSVRRCSQAEPACQSETLLWPQYSAVRSASVSASQTRSGVLSM